MTGVVVALRQTELGGPHPLEMTAGVVVDATGRGRRAPAWLAAMGLPTPPEDVVDADCRYVTRLFQARPDVLVGRDGEIVATDPGSGCSGAALRQEDDRWTVSLCGQFGQAPPADLDAYLPMPVPAHQGIAAVIEGCDPVGDPVPFVYRPAGGGTGRSCRSGWTAWS